MTKQLPNFVEQFRKTISLSSDDFKKQQKLFSKSQLWSQIKSLKMNNTTNKRRNIIQSSPSDYNFINISTVRHFLDFKKLIMERGENS